MLQQFLFVGVGGSGGKTLRILRSLLQRRIREAGYEGFPAGWQFLWIDVPAVQEVNPSGADLPAGSYLGLVGAAISYGVVDQVLLSKGPDAWHGALGWRPEPNQVQVPIAAGAGQYRALGRMIAAANLEAVAGRLETAVAKLGEVRATEDLQQLGRKLGVRLQSSALPPQVVVVSSLVGGSGSGAFIDVCDLVRHMTSTEGWGGDSVAMLYAPEVFDALHASQRKGVQGNTLAALSELLSGYWHDEEPHESDLGFLRAAGVAVGIASHRGPRYPFIIGARNAALGFTEPDDVYRTVGRALAAWALSPATQETMNNRYLGANWTSQASGPDLLGLADSRTPRPFTSLGYASVELGRDRFADYTAERLARRGVEILQRAHWTDRTQKEEAALEQAVSSANGWFLEESGLDERGPEHNQILDALKDPGTLERLKALKASIVLKVEEGGAAKPAPIFAADITERIRDTWNRFVDEEKLHHQQRAKAWVEGIQVRFLAHVGETLAIWGLPVTLRLLNGLAAELDAVVGELREDAGRADRLAGTFGEEVSTQLSGYKLSEKLKPGNPAIDAATSSGLKGLHHKIDSELHSLAAALAGDFKAGYLLPLRDALARGGEALTQGEKRPQPGVSSKVELWAEGDGTVPPRLRPAANVFLVDPVNGYPELFSSKVHETIGGAVPEDSLIQAVREVVVGRAHDVSFAPPPLEQLQTWIPSRADCRPKDASKDLPAAFQIRLDADALLGRAQAWAQRDNTPVSRYLLDSLAGYLDPAAAGPTDHTARLDRFRDCFLNALEMSVPLVRVNNSLLALVNQVNGGPEYTRAFTALPFSQDTPAYETALELLVAKGEERTDAARRFTAGKEGRIELTTLLASPYSPVVFDSLMAPIADEWSAKKRDTDERAAFWQWRRGRPLDEFVPVEPRVLLALVRGWFTARLLDRITGDGIDTPLGVVVSGSDQAAVFPFPLLGALPIEAHDRLPAVLESLPLALVEFTRVHHRAVAGYVALLDLGKGDLEHSYKTYPRANRALVEFISGAPGADVSEAATKARKDHLLRDVAEFKASYAEVLGGPVGDPRHATRPRCQEIADQIREALDQLEKAVGHIELVVPAGASRL